MASRPRETPLVTDRPTVLVADDDPDILELVSFRLRRMHCEPIQAVHGEEAMRIAAEQRPALAILDVMMPHLDGFEVTERIRAHDEIGELPVLMLTARSRDADVQRAFEAGADDYVRKPFSPQELVSRVGALLERSRSSRGATAPAR